MMWTPFLEIYHSYRLWYEWALQWAIEVSTGNVNIHMAKHFLNFQLQQIMCLIFLFEP